MRYQAHIARDRIVRKQAGILHHVSHLAAQRDDIPFARWAILNQYVSSAFCKQAIGQAQDGGLAGAALAQQRKDFSGAQAQRNAGDDFPAIEAVRDIAELEKGSDLEILLMMIPNSL